jgi:hypothetical protein
MQVAVVEVVVQARQVLVVQAAGVLVQQVQALQVLRI